MAKRRVSFRAEQVKTIVVEEPKLGRFLLLEVLRGRQARP